jgi:sulfopyruvate decarboxylase TPP-binding subunit
VSLNQIYDIPVLIVVSWRGEGGEDAPEHLVMGDVMDPLLDLLRIPWRRLNLSTLVEDIAALTRTIRETRQPVALVVSRGQLQR